MASEAMAELESERLRAPVAVGLAEGEALLFGPGPPDPALILTPHHEHFHAFSPAGTGRLPLIWNRGNRLGGFPTISQHVVSEDGVPVQQDNLLSSTLVLRWIAVQAQMLERIGQQGASHP